MDAKSAGGEMSELERRLSEWQPSRAGLDTEGMIFAAGRASVRPGIGRTAWPIVAGCLAVVAIVLGFWLDGERTARQELVAQLSKQGPSVPAVPSDGSGLGEIPYMELPAANSYMASRRMLSENFDVWLVMDKVEPWDGSPPSRPILKARSPGDQLDR